MEATVKIGRYAVWGLLLLGCKIEPEVEVDPPPPLQAGVPVVGAAEGTLKLPVGTPLGGFTSRCTCLGGSSWKDDRASAYNTTFDASTGVHIRPTIKVVWMENGDQHLVMTKTDTVYSFDGLVDALTDRLEQETGLALDGQVTHSANHNHSSYGTFSAHTGFYLGSDRFHQENFERMVDQIAEVALEAYERREEASIGVGWAKDWDPTNQVYGDRRPENNELVVWEDMGPEQGAKDPYMQLIRVDAVSDGSPLAVVMVWGMHPYVFGADMSLVTADATALVEAEVAESFDHPVVAMFLQSSGGDASVQGGDTGWARMESVGLRARDRVLDLWEATPTSGEPILIEALSRAVPTAHQSIRVTRDGAVDWYYPPYEEFYRADDVVYDASGDIVSPLDEFNTQWGAAFCGSGSFDVPVGGLNTSHPAYSGCMQVDLVTKLLQGFFRLDPAEVVNPVAGMSQTYTGAARFGPVPVLRADGEVVEQDVLMGFFPGEPLSMYSEQWRRRASKEAGYPDAILVGYSMDHNGYLAIPEDWLAGGYEPDITFQGPLEAEYIMEEVLAAVKGPLTTDVDEPHDPKRDAFQDYFWQALETPKPDLTPEAGTRLEAETAPEYVWVPDDFELDLTPSPRVPRVQGQVQLAWLGGDPGVDNPRVTLQRLAGDQWQTVTSRSGRSINEDHHDFALTHTPDPLFPVEAEQRHIWWVVWQAVGHIHDRTSLPLGTYRLHVEGQRYLGAAETWPWDTETYGLTSEPFEVGPGEITLTADEGGFWASLEAPASGYRLIDPDGSSRGSNPVRGELTLTWWTGGVSERVSVEAGTPNGGRVWIDGSAYPDATLLEVQDEVGNSGTLDLSGG